MYICLCKNVTDSDIKKSVKNGAKNLHQVRKELDLGTQCCKCLPAARQIIQQELKNKEATCSVPVAAFGLFSPPVQS